MDRVNGADFVDIGGGRRGFRGEDLPAGVAGTEVTALFLNMLQEEVCKVIEDAGLVLNPSDWTQLAQALALRASRKGAWIPVLSMTVTAPPGGAAIGDTYLIPPAATGAWAGNSQKLAEWTGTNWAIIATRDGHGVGLPDGRVFIKVSGVYIQKLALAGQSGASNFAIAAGAVNAITATFDPAPAAITPGMTLKVLISGNNTGPVTFNPNGFGNDPVVHKDGTVLQKDELVSGQVASFTRDTSNRWQFDVSYGRLLNIQIFTSSGTYFPTPGTAFARVRMVGGGAAGAGCNIPAAGTSSLGSPGTSGAYAEGRFTAAQIGASQAVTIGARGLGIANSGGQNGNATSFGALMTAPGGVGGGQLLNQSGATVNGTGSFTAAPTGANILGVQGSAGMSTLCFVATAGVGGQGGDSPFGRGGPGVNANSNGSSATGFGAGGGGVLVGSAVGVTTKGGDGSPGYMIIEEYSL